MASIFTGLTNPRLGANIVLNDAHADGPHSPLRSGTIVAVYDQLKTVGVTMTVLGSGFLYAPPKGTPVGTKLFVTKRSSDEDYADDAKLQTAYTSTALPILNVGAFGAADQVKVETRRLIMGLPIDKVPTYMLTAFGNSQSPGPIAIYATVAACALRAELFDKWLARGWLSLNIRTLLFETFAASSVVGMVRDMFPHLAQGSPAFLTAAQHVQLATAVAKAANAVI